MRVSSSLAILDCTPVAPGVRMRKTSIIQTLTQQYGHARKTAILAQVMMT
jgi:hypothetical protein